MNKISFLLAITFLNVASFAQNKTLEKDDYSIEYPSQWEVKDTSFYNMTITLFKVENFTDKSKRAAVNIMRQDLSVQPMSLEEFKDLSENQLQQMNAKISQVEIKNNVLQFEYSMFDPASGNTAQILQHIHKKDDMFYILSYTAPEGEIYERNKEKVITCLNSFKLK